MTEIETQFFDEYYIIISTFLPGSTEAGLHKGYEWGRKAIEANLGLLQVVGIHQRGLSAFLQNTPLASPEMVIFAGALLEASLAPFEMTHQGYKDSISRLHSLNQTLDRQALELAEANAELDAFGYSVSHDLRAPLRIIGGFTSILLEDYSSSLSEEAQSLCKKIVASTHRMDQLVEALLYLSKVTRADLKVEPVNLTLMLKEIANDLQQISPDRVVQLLIPENLALKGDFQLLRIVMTNLLSNAWKFTAKQNIAQIECGTVSKDGETIYFIKDNGAGFDMHYVNRLFVAFQRLHAKEEFDGTGIGLATVNRIIKRHGGRIWAESELKQGATFFFTIAPSLES